MSVTTAIAIYFLIWWITLFAVLPWGVRRQADGEFVPGSDPGAPAVPALGKKLFWTTIVASVIFAACYIVYTRKLITIENLTSLFELLR
jgi:predicted secreted protein